MEGGGCWRDDCPDRSTSSTLSIARELQDKGNKYHWIATFISLNIKDDTLNIEYYFLNPKDGKNRALKPTVHWYQDNRTYSVTQESLINRSQFFFSLRDQDIIKWLDEKRIMRILLPSNSSDLNSQLKLLDRYKNFDCSKRVDIDWIV